MKRTLYFFGFLIFTLFIFGLGSRVGSTLNWGNHLTTRITLYSESPRLMNKLFDSVIKADEKAGQSFFFLIKRDLAYCRAAKHCGTLRSVLSESEIEELEILHTKLGNYFGESCFENGNNCIEKWLMESFVTSQMNCEAISWHGKFLEAYRAIE